MVFASVCNVSLTLLQLLVRLMFSAIYGGFHFSVPHIYHIYCQNSVCYKYLRLARSVLCTRVVQTLSVFL